VTDDMPEKADAPALWKRLVIRALIGGSGVGLVLACAIGAFYVYRSRSEPWDLNAIRVMQPKTAAVDLSVGLMQPDAALSSARQNAAASASDPSASKPTAPLKAAQEPATGQSGIVTVDLQNATDEDITLPQSLLVMESEEGTHVLHSSKFALDREYFLPARHAVAVTLLADDPCAPENSPEMCVESYFHGVDEIVLFDKPGRFEVHIPLKSIRLLRVEPKQAGAVIVPSGAPR
jgi:hypothetical protein